MFSPGEYLNRWRYTYKESGAPAAASDMLVEGTKRTIVRMFYGVYEVATFPFPSWKLTYRPPYYRKEYVDNWWGYTEFTQDLGSMTQSTYARTQRW
jgi:putative exosortase-associated protein (TIGR04073 family)